MLAQARLFYRGPGGYLGAKPSACSHLAYRWVDEEEVGEVWLAEPGELQEPQWPHALPTHWDEVRRGTPALARR